MPEEMLSHYIARLEEAEQQYQAQFRDSGIVISTMVEAEPLRQGDIVREPILWRLYQHPMVYIVTVPPGLKVPEHSHAENVFRLLLEGSLTVTVAAQNHEIKKGDWFVIKEGTRYSIDTPEGYKCLTGYVVMCDPDKNLGDQC